MDLDADTLSQVWKTPRTLDVVGAILSGITDQKYRNCLLKDAYLLAYADEILEPMEVAFLDELRGLLQTDAETDQAIHQWVKTAIDQARTAESLFGGAPS